VSPLCNAAAFHMADDDVWLFTVDVREDLFSMRRCVRKRGPPS
jgi:hypothetical protein